MIDMVVLVCVAWAVVKMEGVVYLFSTANELLRGVDNDMGYQSWKKLFDKNCTSECTYGRSPDKYKTTSNIFFVRHQILKLTGIAFIASACAGAYFEVWLCIPAYKMSIPLNGDSFQRCDYPDLHHDLACLPRRR